CEESSAGEAHGRLGHRQQRGSCSYGGGGRARASYSWASASRGVRFRLLEALYERLRIGDFFAGRLDFFFEPWTVGHQVWQSAQGSLFAKTLTMRQGGRAADDGLGAHVFGDSAARCRHRAVSHPDVIADSGLAAKYDARAKV